MMAPQAAGAGLAQDGLVGDGLQGLVARSPARRRRTRRDCWYCFTSALRGSTRIWRSASRSRLCTEVMTGQPADELGDQAELDQVLGHDLARTGPMDSISRLERIVGAEADALVRRPGPR